MNDSKKEIRKQKSSQAYMEPHHAAIEKVTVLWPVV